MKPAGRKASVAGKRSGGRDPFEAGIERALLPGEVIGDFEEGAFVQGLERVAREIGELAKIDPARAAGLYLVFAAGCNAKGEEMHEYSPALSTFVVELCVGWIRTRQAAGEASEGTAATLLAWMDDDPYGDVRDLKDPIPKAFDKALATAFEMGLRKRYNAAVQAVTPHGEHPSYRRNFWSDALRTFYSARRNIAAYVVFAEETGVTVKDCRAVSVLLQARGKLEEALAWTEKGLGPEGKDPAESWESSQLAALRRGLLAKLGRGDEALRDAWAAYQGHPGEYTYEELMKFVPRLERSTWHERAMDAAKGKELSETIRLYLGAKETERLAALVASQTNGSLEGESHYVLEPAARRLEKRYPALAARLWIAQGMRVLTAGKSRYYGAALTNFERGKRCYERSGQTAEWKKVVNRVRADHHRKTGFMPDFEVLASDAMPEKRPSFLEVAKARWGRVQD